MHGPPFYKRVLLSIASVLLRIVESCARALVAITHTFQWLLEDVACICAADALVFCLVLISLLAFEFLSFAYIAAAAIGMFDQNLRTHVLPRRLAPILAGIAVFQYCCYIAFPDDVVAPKPAPDPPTPAPHFSDYETVDTLDSSGSSGSSESNMALLHWFGIAPTATQLMVLLATTAVAASAKHTMIWSEATDPTSHSPQNSQSSSSPASPAAHSAAAAPPVPPSVGSPPPPPAAQASVPLPGDPSDSSTDEVNHVLYYQIRAAGLSENRLTVPLADSANIPVRFHTSHVFNNVLSQCAVASTCMHAIWVSGTRERTP